ncbi:MAG: magnesium transporter CorA family protein [Candidatus Kapaibacteriota bacterium]|jgi:magnesium transporter
MISVRRYNQGMVEDIAVSELLTMELDQGDERTMVWVDLLQPTADEEALILGSWFPISELELSDARRAHHVSDVDELHFPKLEEFESHVFLIVHGSLIPPRGPSQSLEDYIPQIRGSQLNIFLNHRVIITHRAVDMGIVRRVQHMLAQNPRLALRGPDFVAAQLIDVTVDDVLHIGNVIEERLLELEHTILERDVRDMAARLMKYRRRVHLLRRALGYQQGLCSRLATGESDFVNADETIYYRDAIDHHVQAIDQLDLLRVTVDSLMDLYFSMTSNRLNQVIRILTVISTVFLPITFITSWYGMNFTHMPEIHWPYGYLWVIGLVGSVGAIMLIQAKRRGWLG